MSLKIGQRVCVGVCVCVCVCVCVRERERERESWERQSILYCTSLAVCCSSSATLRTPAGLSDFTDVIIFSHTTFRATVGV